TSALRFQLRLAHRSLRRTPRLTTAIFLGLALSSAISATAICHYYRYYTPRPALSPALHQVEIPHSLSVERALGGNAMTNAWVGRTRITPREYRVLSGSGIPTRQIATYRSA